MNWRNCIRIFNAYFYWVIPITIFRKIILFFLLYFHMKQVLLVFKFLRFVTLVLVFYFKIIGRGIHLRFLVLFLSWGIALVLVFGIAFYLFLRNDWRVWLLLMVLLLLLLKLILVFKLLWFRLMGLFCFIGVISRHF